MVGSSGSNAAPSGPPVVDCMKPEGSGFKGACPLPWVLETGVVGVAGETVVSASSQKRRTGSSFHSIWMVASSPLSTNHHLILLSLGLDLYFRLTDKSLVETPFVQLHACLGSMLQRFCKTLYASIYLKFVGNKNSTPSLFRGISRCCCWCCKEVPKPSKALWRHGMCSSATSLQLSVHFT